MNDKKITVSLAKITGPNQGVHLGKVSDVRTDNGALQIDFVVPFQGHDQVVAKRYDNFVLKPGSNLHGDLELLLDRSLSIRDLGAEFDLAQVIGATAPIVVSHRRGSGGKTHAEVTLILPRNFQYPPQKA